MAAETAVVKAKRAPPAHPPFSEMITEAIVALKERTGSSQYAITKFVEEKHKQLPQSFRKLLLLNLKKLVASGKLVKVKASFKLPPRSSVALASAAPAKEKTKPVASKAKKSTTAAKTTAKPKAKTVAKPKAKTVAKSKARTVAKPKAAAKPKAKAVVVKKPKASAEAKSAAKASRTSSRNSPGKKVAAKSKAATKVVKKAKSVKSPAKKKKVQPKRASFTQLTLRLYWIAILVALAGGFTEGESGGKKGSDDDEGIGFAAAPVAEHWR
ncbi:hypothetical protein ACLB2K_061123 [Fragaria x ananassa]